MVGEKVFVLDETAVLGSKQFEMCLAAINHSDDAIRIQRTLASRGIVFV